MRVSAIVSIAALGAALFASPALAAAKPDSGRPNIVVILADDLGYADISTYSHRLDTPNIDRIGEEGVVFEDGYVAMPICSPSRAGLMTGRYPQRFGFEYNARQDEAVPDVGLDTKELTLADALKAAGYHTGVVGKWHLGFQDRFYPTNRGFDEFFGHLGGATSYIDPKNPDAISLVAEDFKEYGDITAARSFERQNASRAGGRAILRGPDREVVENHQQYITDVFGDEAAGFIRRNAKEPFFLYAAFNAPHDPFQVTKKYYDRFANVASRTERVYLAMVSALDDAVGNILEALDETGVADNTLVIFLSDNGCAAYIPGHCSCEPLSGGKLTYYEGGVRVPFVLRWPSRVPAGQRIAIPVSSLDIMPTAVAAAGGALPADRAYDGNNLLPYLEGQPAETIHARLVWRAAPSIAIREGQYKLIKLDHNVPGGFLYDLSADPKEHNDISAAHPEVVKKLEATLADWEKITGPPAWLGRDPVAYSVCGIEPVGFPP
ncbi:MAG: sulfatase-like hydrolase/transferase [Alphaproteobacteria bacterium]|nr:sulfatase-like hydrolase/transferase [Alphaproteobacteria bacterium]